MRAGDTVRALDVPPPEVDADDASQLNLTNTDWDPGDPEVATTFVAPTSGTVHAVVGGGLRDNSATNRVLIAPEIRLGDDNTGPVVHRPGAARNSWTNSSFQTANYQYGSRMKPITGLTPGATYHARVMQKVSGGSSADIFNRQIFIIT